MANTSDVQDVVQTPSPASTLVPEAPAATTKQGKMETAYDSWKQSPSPERLRELMTVVNPTINSAITSYAPGSSPSVRSKAKVLAKGAIETFDPSMGVKLNTHLMTQLQQLRREQGKYNSVHMPERVRFDLTKLNQASNQFVDENGSEPTDSELADYTGLSMKRIRHIRKYNRAIATSSAFEAEQEGDKRSLPAVEQAAKLWEDFVYEGLGKKDQLIYELKTGKGGTQQPLSLAEIGKKMTMTPSAVSQRLAKIAEQISNGPEGY